jgi:dihydrofolate reductase
VANVDLTRQLLEDGCVDELRIDVTPVPLGAGLRLLGEGAELFRLEKISVLEVEPRTSLRFRTSS